ncbi:EF-hand domain-containing protein [Algihabitans albus]|uniref:EF-hand domain-containing protein n=1 Tax=Algihabitans albus TaxID=2164067 RepID=UPI0013C2AC4C|nr:calcium-binding protein [Algihabitans albus]
MQLQTKILLGCLLVTGLVLAAVGGASADRGYGGGHGGRGGHMMQMFERVDLDGDGQVTRAELTEYRNQRFGDGDANGDGALELAEFEAVWLAMVRERMVDRFQSLDADGDGRITAAEFDQPLDRMFGRFDADEDGTVSRSEIREHHGQRRHRD